MASQIFILLSEQAMFAKQANAPTPAPPESTWWEVMKSSLPESTWWEVMAAGPGKSISGVGNQTPEASKDRIQKGRP